MAVPACECDLGIWNKNGRGKGAWVPLGHTGKGTPAAENGSSESGGSTQAPAPAPGGRAVSDDLFS